MQSDIWTVQRTPQNLLQTFLSYAHHDGYRGVHFLPDTVVEALFPFVDEFEQARRLLGRHLDAGQPRNISDALTQAWVPAVKELLVYRLLEKPEQAFRRVQKALEQHLPAGRAAQYLAVTSLSELRLLYGPIQQQHPQIAPLIYAYIFLREFLRQRRDGRAPYLIAGRTVSYVNPRALPVYDFATRTLRIGDQERTGLSLDQAYDLWNKYLDLYVKKYREQARQFLENNPALDMAAVALANLLRVHKVAYLQDSQGRLYLIAREGGYHGQQLITPPAQSLLVQTEYDEGGRLALLSFMQWRKALGDDGAGISALDLDTAYGYLQREERNGQSVYRYQSRRQPRGYVLAWGTVQDDQVRLQAVARQDDVNVGVYHLVMTRDDQGFWKGKLQRRRKVRGKVEETTLPVLFPSPVQPRTFYGILSDYVARIHNFPKPEGKVGDIP